MSEIFAAPGNAGMAETALTLDIRATDFPALTRAVEEKRIDLVVVGPEDPLAAGIVDHFKKIGIAAFGPDRLAAQLEASKVFSKGLLQKYHIPCAASASFSDLASARRYAAARGAPLWIKADGLAAGKGAVFAGSLNEADEILSSMMESRIFGASGETVVIEDQLVGREMSAFAITDGITIVPAVPACDYKRVYDGDRGPNTGGMGCYTPPSFLTAELEEKVQSVVMGPVVRAMAKEGRPYRGVLYGGLMINNGEPSVIEFNARFGDPECQVILPRLKTDLLDLVLGTVNGNLDTVQVSWSDEACVGVALASGGYPGKYQTGFPITGLN